jgi:cytochrome P450
METCARRYGETFTLRSPGSPPMVFTSDPTVIKQVFSGDPRQFHAGKANIFLKPFLGDNSLLVLDEKPHLRQRKLLLGPLHGERMQAYGETMRRITDRVIDGWPLGRPFPLQDETQAITLDVILETVFGMGSGAEQRQLRELLKRFINFGTGTPLAILMVRADGEIRGRRLQRALGPLSPISAFERLLAELDEALYGEIHRRRGVGLETHEDVLALLLGARDEAGQPMSDAEIRDQLLTLLSAGHETTATALTFVVQSFLEHPEVLAEVRAEIERVVGAGDLVPRIGQLEYLDATIKEALRLRPVAPVVGRVLAEPMELGPWRLPAGVMVVPTIYLAHRRPEAWKDPERFDPRRFLDGKPTPAEYFPFGGGVRRCIGAAFATYEMKVVLGQLVRRTRLEAVPGYRPRMIRRSFTLALDKGLPLILAARDAAPPAHAAAS